MTVWKFPLGVDDTQVILVPRKSKPLHLETQQGVPCLWILVDPDQPKEKRTILTYGTGHTIDDTPKQYIGSYMIHDDMLVFHVFLETLNGQDH